MQKPQEHGHICTDTGVFTHHGPAVECVMWRTRSNTKIWVLREETKHNFFSRKHIKAPGVRACERQGFRAPPSLSQFPQPQQDLEQLNDPPSVQSPALGCPAGLGSTSKPRRCPHVCPERTPRRMLPLPRCNPNLLATPVRRPTCLGASAEVVWTSAPRRPLDSNTTVGTRGVLAAIRAITDQALSPTQTPAPSPRLENTNLPSHFLQRL